MSRAVARNAAMQMIFERLGGGQGGEETLQMVYNELREEGNTAVSPQDPGVKDLAYIQAALQGVIEHLDEIDEKIGKYARNWTVDRMPAVDRTILRLAAWEILYGQAWDVPGQVAIKEAVTLAKTYANEDSGRFINGVLGSLLRDNEAAQ
ncbi:MAG: transcription antitermination factor NusB [Clostridia bacterium]|nr:transcription antitermination factor NusB [Clostridia bacterium]